MDNGWFIPDSGMSTIAQETFVEMMNIIRTGGAVDVHTRIDGENYQWQCDGLKYATRINYTPECKR